MALTDTQLETLARDLLSIARCARQLHADIEPKRPTVGDDGAWHRPTYGPKPPCDVRIVSLLDEAGRLLGWYLRRVAEDFITAPIPDAEMSPGQWAASRDSTTHAKANRLYEQRHYIADREWATEFLNDIEQLKEKLGGFVEPLGKPLPAQILDQHVTASEGARILGIPVGTIHRWGSEGVVHRAKNACGKTVYRLRDLRERRP